MASSAVISVYNQFMRVGIDVSQIVYGTGVSDYTINLVRALQETRPELELSLFGSSFRRQSDIKAIFPQAKTFPYPPMLLHYLWNILHIYPVENFIGQVNVFHASDWTQPPSFAPSVTTVHDLSPFLFPGEMGRAIVTVHQARMKRVVSQCNKIICVSRSTAEDLKKLFKLDETRIKVIPEGLPARFDLDPSDLNIKNIKSKFGLSDYVIAVGTPQPRKNYLRLANSFLNFKSKYRLPEKLVIVGGGGWGGQIPSHTSIIKTGYIPDQELVALVKGASSLVLPSLYEGFGLPILLAWRQNVPVSVSNISSLPEVLGEAGVLFDPSDEEAIANAIAVSIKNKKTLIDLSKSRLNKFNWINTAKDTFSVYKTLC